MEGLRETVTTMQIENSQAPNQAQAPFDGFSSTTQLEKPGELRAG
jgi:hypothetical protein